jgi:hypothetical protein
MISTNPIVAEKKGGVCQHIRMLCQRKETAPAVGVRFFAGSMAD